MSYWRKLFIVVLVALSLPAQSFAAISMKCVIAHADASEGPSQRLEEAMIGHQHDAYDMTLSGRNHHGNAHHVHSCSTCASCCYGTGLFDVPAVAVYLDATRVAGFLPLSDGVVPFLTGGIERPSRSPFV